MCIERIASRGEKECRRYHPRLSLGILECEGARAASNADKGRNRPSEAKACPILAWFPARINPCPFKAENSGRVKAENFWRG